MRQRSIVTILCLGLFSIGAALAAQTRVEFAAADFAAVADTVATGHPLTVAAVPLPGLAEAVALELRRFEVFAADARIVVHGVDGDEVLQIPDNRYFRGQIAGRPASVAYLAVRQGGEVRGIVADGGRYWIVGNFDGARRLPRLVAKRVPDDAFAAAQSTFDCGAGDLAVTPGEALRGLLPPDAPSANLGGAPAHTARVAIETDNEFLALFAGNTVDAIDYLADLVGFSSGLFLGEIATDLDISFISLWTAADPWAQFSTLCGLFEFGRYWNDNYGGSAGGELYTISHFMSGKNNGGGIAWGGVLCRAEFDYNHQGACSLVPQTDNYGGPFGYSGDLDGNFDLDNPAIVWDIYVVSHEIGHNFDSPHTHCYAGVQGNPNEIDRCHGQEEGCYSGATALPSGCPGAGMACGTVMSYCHLLSPGLSNIALSFGTGHPYGVAPQRVPAQMLDHVLAVAGTSPACLAPVATTVFADGFESGDTSAWSSALP